MFSEQAGKVRRVPTDKRPSVAVRAVVGSNIRRIRELRGLTVRDFAARLKDVGLSLSASGVSEVENAQRKLGVDELLVIAVALNTSIVELLTPADRMPLGITDSIEPVPEGFLELWLQGDRPWPIDADLDNFFEAASATRQHDRMLRKRPDVSAIEYLNALTFDIVTAMELSRDDSKLAAWAAQEAPRFRDAIKKARQYAELLADELESRADGG